VYCISYSLCKKCGKKINWNQNVCIECIMKEKMEEINSKYLDSRANIEYNEHDEMQMVIIVDKIVVEMKRRYGERLYLIKNTSLQKLVRHWKIER